MADKKPNPSDTRSPEEIKHAQKSLVKMLSFATGVPVIFVIVMAWSLMEGKGGLGPEEQNFAQFMAYWGILTPVVWIGCYGYTWFQIMRDNMDAGRILPLVPALWVIFWFAALYTR